jgi:hypothetical protein
MSYYFFFVQDPIDVPYSAESREHEDKECTNKVNDDLLVIQSAKEIVAGTQENKEMQNEAKAVHAESQTKTEEEEEMSQLHDKEPHNLDTKVDDTAHGAEIIHDNTTVQPREIEEMGEDMGLSSIYKPVVETSEQNNVEQDFSIHHKVSTVSIHLAISMLICIKIHTTNFLGKLALGKVFFLEPG